MSSVSSGVQKSEIQPLVAASGHAGIFSNKAVLRLKSTLCPTGVASKVNSGGVFSQEYTTSPKYRIRE